MKKIKKNSDALFIAGMLFLPTLSFLVFYLYVNIDSLLLAFQVPTGDTFKWGFDNFATMFKDFSFNGSVLGIAIKNTALYFFTGLLVTLPLSFFLSYFLYKKVLGYRIFRVIYYLPCIISASVLVALFKYFIQFKGPVDALSVLLGKGHLPPFFFRPDLATHVINFYCVFYGLGGNLVLFSGAMSNIDKSIIEAGNIDGMGMKDEIFNMVIPIIWPTLSTVIIFQFINIFSASGPILLFTSGSADTWTISYWIYHKVAFGATLNYPSAVGLFFSVLGIPIVLVMRWLINKCFVTE